MLIDISSVPISSLTSHLKGVSKIEVRDKSTEKKCCCETPKNENRKQSAAFDNKKVVSNHDKSNFSGLEGKI